MKFLWVGKTKDTLYKELEKRYLKRISYFLKAEQGHVAELKKVDPRQSDAQLGKEAQLLEKRLTSGAYLVCLDETGDQISSLELADFLEKLINQGVGCLTLVVGGHAGLSKGIKERANRVLSLGRMTLPHELARVLLLEQIYRAFTLIRKVPYHR